jgi:hypothetical protein
VKRQGGHGGARPESNVMPDEHLVPPVDLKDAWVQPIALAFFFAIPVCFPTYSSSVLLFAASVCIPLQAWCISLSIWARDNQLTGDVEVDRQRIVDATASHLHLASVLTPIHTILCLLIGLAFLLSIKLIGLLDYVFLLLLCVFGIALCLFVPEESVRRRADWVLETLDKPRWRLLGGVRKSALLLIALALVSLVVGSVVLGADSEEEFVALLLGPACVVGAFLYVPYTSIDYHKWKRFTGLREAGWAAVAEAYVSKSSELPIWCVQCDKQGFIFVDDAEQPYFVVCKRCGWETSEVFCPKCVIGGEFVEDVDKRPTSWRCPECGTEYNLPQSFYDEPVPLYLEEDLSQPGDR